MAITCRSGASHFGARAATAAPAWNVGDAHAMMRDWYNGYRFALGAEEAVYNPTLVLYFLKHLQRTGASPRQMLDSNLAADEGKLDVLAHLATGHDVAGQQDVAPSTLRVDGVIDLIRKDEPLEIRQLLDRFTLKELLEHSSQDMSFLGSYLYYFGMLTLRKEETEQQTLELVVPNEVMHSLYVERIRRILMPLGASRSAADAILFAFLRSGHLEPLLDFIEATLFPTFSNRDATWANELTVKTVFLTLLWNDTSYVTHSEPELDHRYADLCLLRRPDAQASSLWDLLFEFKRLSLKQLGMSGKDIQTASRAELMEQALVKEAPRSGRGPDRCLPGGPREEPGRSTEAAQLRGGGAGFRAACRALGKGADRLASSQRGTEVGGRRGPAGEDRRSL